MIGTIGLSLLPLCLHDMLPGDLKQTSTFWNVMEYLKSCLLNFLVVEVKIVNGTELSLFNPLNPELNPTCYLLALLGAHNFLHVSKIRVKLLTFRRLMSYIYGAPILDVSRSHATTQHSR